MTRIYKNLADKYHYKYNIELAKQNMIPRETGDGKYLFPVDAVITWVDGSDPEWQSIYRDVTGKKLDRERFIDTDELYYCLQGIEAYLPWIRNIFLVTMRPQQPKYLEQFKRVTIIYHDQIYRDNEDLPTFNSESIETQLDQIPGLSEQFLYFNDDVFVARPLEKSYFFTEMGYPILYKRHKVNQYCHTTMREIHKTTGLPILTHTPQHYPYSLTKSGYRLIYSLFPDATRKQASLKVRTPLDGWHFWIIDAIYMIYYYNEMAQFPDKLPDHDGLRFFMPALKREHAKEKLVQYRHQAPAFININNIDTTNDYHMEVYHNLIGIFKDYLREKSHPPLITGEQLG